MIKNNMVKLIVLAILGFAITGCSNLDVVGKTAITSFNALNAALSNATFDATASTWTMSAPDGQALILSSQSKESPVDATMRLHAAPFLKAGLDQSKLPAHYVLDEANEALLITVDLGDIQYSNDTASSMDATFNALVTNYRKSIDYHEALDHYGLLFGGGNAFEWAKDLKTNDKDIVFVLNPEVLINAGVNPDAVEGWVFTKVDIKDATGAVQKVDKLLKPYTLAD